MNSYKATATSTNGQPVKLNPNPILKKTENESSNESSVFFILEEESTTQTIVVEEKSTEASSSDEQEIYSVIMTDEIALNTGFYQVLEIDPTDQKQLALVKLDLFYNNLNQKFEEIREDSSEFEEIREDSSEFEIIGEYLPPIIEPEDLEYSFEELKVPSQDNVYQLSYKVKLRELGGLQSIEPRKILILPNTYDKFATFFSGMVESLTTKASAKSIIAPFVLLFIAIPFFFAKKINSSDALVNRIEKAQKDDEQRIQSAKLYNEKIEKDAKKYAESMKFRWIKHYERNYIKNHNSVQLEKTNTTVTKIMEKLLEEVELFPYRVHNEMRYLFNKLFS